MAKVKCEICGSMIGIIDRFKFSDGYICYDCKKKAEDFAETEIELFWYDKTLTVDQMRRLVNKDASVINSLLLHNIRLKRKSNPEPKQKRDPNIPGVGKDSGSKKEFYRDLEEILNISSADISSTGIYEMLSSNERVRGAISGDWLILHHKTVQLILTNQRVILYEGYGLPFMKTVKQISISQIVNCSYNAGILNAEIEINSANDSIRIGKVFLASAKPFVEMVNQVMNEQQTTPINVQITQPTEANTSSIADELLKLKNLVDIGVLSTEEFEQQKKKLLS